MGSSFSCSADGQIVEQVHLDIDIPHSASRTMSMTQTPRAEQSGSAEALSFASDPPRHCVESGLSPEPDALDVPPVAMSLSTTSSIYSFEPRSAAESPPVQPIHRTASLMSADSLLSPISPSNNMKPELPPAAEELVVVSPTDAQDHEFGSCVLSSGDGEFFSITSDTAAEQLRPTDIAPLERQDSSLSPSAESPHPMAEGSGFTSLNNLIREGGNGGGDMITSPCSVLGKVVLLRAPLRAQSIAGAGPRVTTPMID